MASQDDGFNRFWKWMSSCRQAATERMCEAVELSPLQAALVVRIRAAFAGASLAQLRKPEVRGDWEQIPVDLQSIVLTDDKSSVGLTALLHAEQHACVSDFVNQKRLDEVHQGYGLIAWDRLLPWEEEERRVSSPTQSPPGYAEDMLLRYCGQHGIPL